jgi:hypothetical protein
MMLVFKKILNSSLFPIQFMDIIQHGFICRPSDFTVSDDAGIEPMIVATLALTARRLNYSAIAHPHSAELFLVEIFELL